MEVSIMSQYSGDEPSEYEQIENAKRMLGELFFEFTRQAINEGRPPRYYRTFWSLLWIARGRLSFITGVGLIVAVSRQGRATVFRALDDLDEAGWISRENRIGANGYWWVKSRYYIRRLETTQSPK
jgi:hypothetical protein